MDELVLTHNVNGMANVVYINYENRGVRLKRVPSDSPMLAKLMQSGKIRKSFSDLGAEGAVWLFEKYLRGWVSVAVDGSISHTLESKGLETDDTAFLAALTVLPEWSHKSKVFVAKLLHMGHQVALRDYIKPACTLTPDVASVFRSLYAGASGVRVAPECYEDVERLEMFGHTLNRLYGSDIELLDPAHLNTLRWLPPVIRGDAVLFQGETKVFNKTLYVYLKGDSVFYVGYHTLAESYGPTFEKRKIRDVLTFESLMSPACVGLIEITGDYKSNRLIKVCGESLQDGAHTYFTEFLWQSTVLLAEHLSDLPAKDEEMTHTSWLYDLVNDKIYVFKAFAAYGRLGNYYGEMSVDEWLARR